MTHHNGWRFPKMPLLQFLFLLSAWKRSLSKRIKRDGNIETIKCKNGANLKSWSYYHAIVLVNLLNLPKYVIILKQLLTLWRLTTYICLTAQLTSRCCILNIYSTNILTEYFKHAAHSPFFPLQDTVYLIMLSFLVPLIFAF